jgi:hypothetical protein
VASRKGARREPAKCPHPVVPSRPQLRPSHVLQAERGPKTTIVCSIEVALRKNWYSSTPPFQVTILLTSRFLRPTTDLNSRPAVSGAGPSLYSDAAPLSSILSTKRWIPTPISRRLPNPGLAFTSKIAELAKIKAIRPGQNQPTTTPVLHCTEKGQSRKEDASGLHSKKETRPQKPRALTSVRDSRRHQDVSESGLTAARGCDYTLSPNISELSITRPRITGSRRQELLPRAVLHRPRHRSRVRCRGLKREGWAAAGTPCTGQSVAQKLIQVESRQGSGVAATTFHVTPCVEEPSTNRDLARPVR